MKSDFNALVQQALATPATVSAPPPPPCDTDIPKEMAALAEAQRLYQQDEALDQRLRTLQQTFGPDLLKLVQ